MKGHTVSIAPETRSSSGLVGPATADRLEPVDGVNLVGSRVEPERTGILAIQVFRIALAFKLVNNLSQRIG